MLEEYAADPALGEWITRIGQVPPTAEGPA